MSQSILQTPIVYLKGVGPQRADILQKELGIFTFQDLLYHFPFRYIDRSKHHLVKDVPFIDAYVQLKGVITNVVETKIGRVKKLSAKFQDESGTIELVWFQGFKWIKDSIKSGQHYQVFGRAKYYGSSWNIPHPELQLYSEVEHKSGFQAIYSSTEKLASAGLTTKGIEKLCHELTNQIKGKIQESLPDSLLKKHHLISRENALLQIHKPHDQQAFQQARFRLKYEELLFLQLELLLRKHISMEKSGGFVFPKIDNYFDQFYHHHLPFELTNAQKRVLKEIRNDVLSGKHMNRLVQGDVGCGKTLVALMSMLMAVDNGFQAALMAPTEILATQHFHTIEELVKPMSMKVALLTGSTKTKERRLIHEQLLNGEIQILIGTHALLEDQVQFSNLGLVVIDEQHRFGVAQRARMRKKNTIAPHILIMTATPIPRTLAMTFYGDLDVSVIDELPPGRKPIQTYHFNESKRSRLFGFVREEIAKGRQIYFVYPLIQESEKMDFNNLMDGFNAISRTFPLPDYQVSIVHGKMKAEVKDYEMNRFIDNETNIMVATTVIEVGVNVPNASVMVIESAERFGLSQLHQLRGRVGRGAEKSYCVLMTGDKLSKETLTRLETMVRTNDGFEIAEADLKLRGPGDLMGTQQSGILGLKIADLAKDQQIVQLARDDAKEILKIDPALNLQENILLRTHLSEIFNTKPDWGKIG